MRLYITSISATPIPHLEYKLNRWKKYITLFCVNEKGQTIILVCPFRPYILFKFAKEPNFDLKEDESGPRPEDIQLQLMNTLAAINNELFQKKKFNKDNDSGSDDEDEEGYEDLHMEPVWKKPSFGWTNSRIDKLWKVSYSQINSRNKLVDHLSENGFCTTKQNKEEDEQIDETKAMNFGKVTVMHQKTLLPNQEGVPKELKQRKFGFSDEEHFKQVTDLHAHTWIDVDLNYQDPSTQIQASKHAYPQKVSKFCQECYTDIFPESITQLHDILTVPPLSVIQLKKHAFSNDATNTNPYQPKWSKPKDRLDMIACMHYRLDQPINVKIHKNEKSDAPNNNMEEKIVILENQQDEKDLLLQLKDYIEYTNPHIIVQSSCLDNDLEYIIQRAKYVFGDDQYFDLGLSVLEGCSSRVVYYGEFIKQPSQVKEEEKKIQTIEHVGRERLDLIFFLQKFQTSPPLKDFSLLEAYYHEKLIKNKDKRNLELDCMQLHHRPERKDVIRKLKQELKVMYCLCNDNSVVQSQMLLAKFCDASVQTICERGVELQTRNFIMKRYVRKGFYMNHETLNEQCLVVKRKRCNSSFPHPPDIENPSEKSIMGIKTRKIQPRFNMKRFFLKPGQSLDTELQKETKKTKKGYSGGLVVDSEPGLRLTPRQAVVILDFASLYPSVIRGFLLCYMGVLMECDAHIEKDPRATIRYIPLDDDHCFVFVTHWEGKPIETIIPEITAEIMIRRDKLKAEMKKAKMVEDWDAVEALDCRQLTAKVQANALYGFIGSKSSGMNMTAVAAAVCLIAQALNRECIYKSKKRGNRVIGGDTDSSFNLMNVCDVCPPDQQWTKEQLYSAIIKKGVEFGKICSEPLPYPNKYVPEAVKQMLTTDCKKLHCSLAFNEPPYGWDKFDWSKAEPELCIKGAAFKKRDRCAFVQENGLKFVEMILYQKPEAEILQFLKTKIQEIKCIKYTNVQDLKPFIITCCLGDENEYKVKTILALHLKKEIYEETGITVLKNRRMEYVVARFKDGRKRYLHAMTKEKFIREGYLLDTTHYIMTQFYTPLQQLTAMHLPTLDRAIFNMFDQYAMELEMKADGHVNELNFSYIRTQNTKMNYTTGCIEHVSSWSGQSLSAMEPEQKQKEIPENKMIEKPNLTSTFQQIQVISEKTESPRPEKRIREESYLLKPVEEPFINNALPLVKPKRPRINLSDLGIGG